jgi:hypothetical protein
MATPAHRELIYASYQFLMAFFYQLEYDRFHFLAEFYLLCNKNKV